MLLFMVEKVSHGNISKDVYVLGFTQVGITAIANLMASSTGSHFDLEKVHRILHCILVSII